MKFKAWACLLLAMAPFISGCKHFWDVPSGSGGGKGSASGFFYVLNQKTAQIAGFSFAANATTLTSVSGSPYSLSTSPIAATISPNGGFLYISTGSGIFAFSVNGSTGALTLLNNSTAISSDPATVMTIATNGVDTWLIEAVSLFGSVSAIPLDPTTGVLLGSGTVHNVSLPSGSAAVQQVTVTRSGAANSYVFVALGTTGVAIIPFNAGSSGNPFGTVTTIKPKNGGGDTAVAVDLNNSVLYVGETVALTSGSNPAGVRMFSIGANSTLTEVSGSPYGTGGLAPSAILPTSSYIYVANKTVSGSNSGSIIAFAINTSGGTASGLTAVTSGTISAGATTQGLAEESTGTYILAVNASGSPDLNAYTIDSTTGALKSYATASTGNDPTQPVAIVAP